MERIGLEAVLDDADFNKGLKSYEKGLDKAESQTGSVAKNITGKLKGIGSGLLNLGATAAKLTFGVAVAGATALTGALIGSVKAAMDASVVDAQLDAVLKSTGGAAGMTKDAVLGLADSLSKMTLFEDDAIIAGENMLLTFTNIGSDVFPAATETMLDMSQALGQDLKTSAIQLGKALNDPIAGVSALSKVGVTFTEEQKKVIKSLVETGDVAGAQRIILAELTREFGGSAKAAGETLPGQLTILKNTLGNVAETIGAVALPMLISVAKVINEKLASPATQALIAGLASTLGSLFKGDLSGAIASFAGALSNVFGPARALQIYQFLLSIQTGIGTLKTWVDKNGPTILSALSTAFDWVKDNVVPPLKLAIGAVLTGIGNLKTWVDTNGPVILSALTTAFNTVKDTVLPPLKTAFGEVQTKIGEVKTWLDTNGPLIMAEVTKAFNWVKDNVIPPLKTAIGEVQTKIGELKTWLDTEGPDIKTTLVDAFTVMQGKSTEFADNITTYVVPRLNDWKKWFDDQTPLIEKIWSGFMNNMKTATKGSTEDQTSIVDLFFVELLKQMDTQLETAKTIVNTALRLLSGDWQGVWDEIVSAQWLSLESAKIDIRNAWDSIKQNLSDVWKLILGQIRASIGDVREALKNKTDQIYGDAVNIWNDIKGAIVNPILEAKNKILEFVGGIRTALEGIGNIKIKLPHIDISWRWVGIEGGPGFNIPSFSINWYKHGLDAIFDKPTIIGVGEAGAERVQVTPLGQQRQSQNASTYNNSTVYNQFYLTAQYSTIQSESSLRDTVRLLQAGV